MLPWKRAQSLGGPVSWTSARYCGEVSEVGRTSRKVPKRERLSMRSASPAGAKPIGAGAYSLSWIESKKGSRPGLARVRDSM